MLDGKLKFFEIPSDGDSEGRGGGCVSLPPSRKEIFINQFFIIKGLFSLHRLPGFSRLF